MKRVKSLLLIAIFVVTFCFQGFAYASSAQVNAAVDQAAGKVTISGSGFSANQYITVQVITPSGGLDYIDQTTSSSEGTFLIEYKTVNGYGTYTVKVNANITTVFNYTGPTDPVTPPPTSGGNAGYVPPTTRVDVVEDGSVSITQTPNKNESTKVVESTIDKATFESALSKAQVDSAGNKNITIDVKKVDDAKGYALTLPGKALASENKHAVTIKTGVATVQLSNTTFSNYNIKEEDQVELFVGDLEQVENENKKEIEVYFKVNGQRVSWNNPTSPVQVSVPYVPSDDEDVEHLVIIYIDGQGNRIPIYNGRYNAEKGTMDFTTSHFSRYAVAYVQKSFGDLTGFKWAQKPIEVLASKGIIRGTSDTTFNPSANISRADFVVLLVRTLGLTAPVNSNFVDVKPSDYFYNEVGIAKALGIALGGGDNTFNPKAQITRQDMMALTARAIAIAGVGTVDGDTAVLTTFVDKDAIATYAQDAIATLVNNGLINGYEDNTIRPQGNATRAETASFMYRLFNFK